MTVSMADERTPLITSAGTNGLTERPPSRAEGAACDRHDESYNDRVTSVANAQQERSTLKLILILSTLWINAFFAALDGTVVATLSGPISASFESGTSFSWIATGYLISNAAFQPISGKLTDIYGRRAGLTLAITIFALGTAMCGFAQSISMMIAGRVIAGIGGGCINTVGVFIISDLVPLRKRGVYQGFSNIVYGSGMALGGVYGGFVNDRIGWRYAFYYQLPFILLGGLCSYFAIDIPIKEMGTPRIRRVDVLGALTLVSSLALLMLGLNSGGNTLPWNHPVVIASLILGTALLAVFIHVEQTLAQEPIIPINLMKNRTVLASAFYLWFQMMAQYALYYYAPLFLQVVNGESATASGILFVPQSLSISLGSLSARIIMRWTGRYRWMAISMQGLCVVSMALVLAFLRPSVSEWLLYIFVGLLGLGGAHLLTITLLAMISSLDHEWQAVVTSISYAFRSTGAVIGITVASTIFQNLLKLGLEDLYGNRPGAAEEIQKIRDSTEYVKRLPPLWRAKVVERFVEALRGVWIMSLGLVVLAFIFVCFIRENKLHITMDRK